jgi:hypothetical protein
MAHHMSSQGGYVALLAFALVLAAAGCGGADGRSAARTQARSAREASAAVSDSVAQKPPENCPPRQPQRMVHTSWPPAQHKLIPPGAVAARLCSYSGLGNSHGSFPPLSLMRSRLVDTAGPLARLAADYNALALVPQHNIQCPLADGSEIVAFIAYPGGQPLTITLRDDGCPEVTNGALLRFAYPTAHNPAAAKLYEELHRLIKPSRART